MLNTEHKCRSYFMMQPFTLAKSEMHGEDEYWHLRLSHESPSCRLSFPKISQSIEESRKAIIPITELAPDLYHYSIPQSVLWLLSKPSPRLIADQYHTVRCKRPSVAPDHRNKQGVSHISLSICVRPAQSSTNFTAGPTSWRPEAPKGSTFPRLDPEEKDHFGFGVSLRLILRGRGGRWVAPSKDPSNFLIE